MVCYGISGVVNCINSFVRGCSLPSTCRLLFIIIYNYTKISRFTLILSIKIVLSCFYLLIFHFEKFLSLNATFAVCRNRYA